MGVTFPVLHDADGAVHAAYAPSEAEASSVYPQDWLIGSDGRVVYVSRSYEPEVLRELVEHELSQP